MSVTAAKGFLAAGTSAGIKASGALDIALIAAEGTTTATGVFTRSRTAAPPVLLSRGRLDSGVARAVVVNSGCANAGTGDAGLADAEAITARVAELLGCEPREVLMCSTGPIGTVLPRRRIEGALPNLVARMSPDGSDHAATAIMTTDSVPKSSVRRTGGVTVGGIAKGAGMLRPDMATMLAFLTTDAVLDASLGSRALRSAVETTFNCLNVDGCQSTNDTVILMASGESGVALDPGVFTELVRDVCADLALQMAADAEGASKVVRIEVTGAPSDPEAAALGRAVADSALVRSSFYGADPNWGRVLAALGVAGIPLDPAAVQIAYEGVPVCAGGVGALFDDDAVSALIQGDFTVSISVGEGSGRAAVITTDLTPDYVRFNGERS